MASKNVIAKGTTYNGVESITLPTSPSGSATFYEISDTTAVASDVLNSKWFYAADGTFTQGTGTGGGGGTYDWLGTNTEYLGEVYSETFNLSTDTSYDTWTPTTTATAILAEPSANDAEVAVALQNYDYTFIYTVETDIALKQTATLKNIPTKYVYVRGRQLYATPSRYAEYSSGNYTANANSDFSTKAGMYYYNSSGGMAASSTAGGPMYIDSFTFSTSTNNGTLYMNIKRGDIRAKCSSTSFATARAADIDSANTVLTCKVIAFRTPKSFSRGTVNMLTDLLNN